MISDEKRREIASNLRESREFISGLPSASLGQNAFDTFERILACVGYESGNIFDYLADLIEPTGYRPTVAMLAEAEHLRALSHGVTINTIEMRPYELAAIATLLERGGVDD